VECARCVQDAGAVVDKLAACEIKVGFSVEVSVDCGFCAV
jgi:hypothetical protein